MDGLYKDIVAIRLGKAREKLGFSIEDVENETGITVKNLLLYESGKREPSLNELGALIVFYGISADWLFGINPKAEIQANVNVMNT